MRGADIGILAVYLGAMAAMGWYFARRAKNTEQYCVAGRAYPGRLIGVSLFGATISSITFVGYPADAYYTDIVSNGGMFAIGFGTARLVPERTRDLRNLTV